MLRRSYSLEISRDWNMSVGGLGSGWSSYRVSSVPRKYNCRVGPTRSPPESSPWLCGAN